MIYTIIYTCSSQIWEHPGFGCNPKTGSSPLPVHRRRKGLNHQISANLSLVHKKIIFCCADVVKTKIKKQ